MCAMYLRFLQKRRDVLVLLYNVNMHLIFARRVTRGKICSIL